MAQHLRQEDPPTDADDWRNKTDKLALLSEAPA
nr:DUF3470 domain-containing protein [Sulfitobacter algicola]